MPTQEQIEFLIGAKACAGGLACSLVDDLNHGMDTDSGISNFMYLVSAIGILQDFVNVPDGVDACLSDDQVRALTSNVRVMCGGCGSLDSGSSPSGDDFGMLYQFGGEMLFQNGFKMLFQ